MGNNLSLEITDSDNEERAAAVENENAEITTNQNETIELLENVLSM